MLEGYFSHKIGDKDIHFFIGVYSLEKSLEEINATISDLEALDNKNYLAFIRAQMFYSAEYQALKNREDFPYIPFDVYGWIDETGGHAGSFYMGFVKAFMKSMGLSAAKPEESQAEPEKKSLKVKPKPGNK